MASIVISDSSDDDIQFFAEPPKPKHEEDDDVVFCGVRNLNSEPPSQRDAVKERHKIPPTVSKDVTVVMKTVRRDNRVHENHDSDDEVKFLGIKKKENETSSMKDRNLVKSAGRRARSDSVNININRNLTINIEDDTESNKKKVQLTFLGPRSSNRLIQSPINNSNKPLFKPLISSTPMTSKHVVGKGTDQAKANQGSLKTGNRVVSSLKNNCYTTLHSSSLIKKTEQQLSGTVTPNKNTQPLNLQTLNQKSITTSNTIKKNWISVPGDNMSFSYKLQSEKSTAENLSRNEAPQISAKSQSVSSIKNTTVLHDYSATPQLEKSKTEMLQVFVPKESLKPKEPDLPKSSKPIPEKETRSSDIESEDKKTKVNTEKCSNSKNGDRSPVASPCRQQVVTENSSSGSEDESSTDDSRSRNEDDSSTDASEISGISKPLMSKSDLDSLFDKFTDKCISISTKNDVLKMKVKLKKVYTNSENLTNNNDFINVLKEVVVRMERKPVRCPLDLMKKVLTELRKDTPSNERRIALLENALNKINKKIKEFEEAEVTSDEDETDNIYIQLNKYKKKAVQIYDKLCELSSMPADAERPTLRNVSFQGTIPEEFAKTKCVPNLVVRISRALEKYYNKSRKFPDFHDVKTLMRKLCAEGGFKLRPDTLHQLTKSIFEEFGDMLQKRRLYDDYKICNEYLSDDEDDPYYSDPVLAAKIDANKKLRKAEKEVLQKYALEEVLSKEDGFSNEDSDSASSSQSESDKHKKKAKKKKHKTKNRSNRSSGEESDSDASLVRSSADKNKRKKRRSSDSSDKSKTSEEEDEKKSNKKRIKRTKRTASSDESSVGDLVKNQSVNSRNTRERSPAPCSSTNEADKSKSNKELDENSEVGSIINKKLDKADCSSIVLYNYEDAPTICIEEKCNLLEKNENNISENDITDINKVVSNNDTNKVIEDDDDVMILDQQSTVAKETCETVNVINDVDKPPLVLVDDNTFTIDIIDDSPQSESTTNVDQQICYTGNNSGIIITNVQSCPELLITQNEQTMTIDLLSDDESELSRPQNHLSQEDVLNLIPLILGPTNSTQE